MPRSTGRTLRLWVFPALLAIVATGCGPTATEQPVRDTPPVLTTSTVWRDLVDPATFRDRLASLTDELNDLRADTRSGWIGTQDDATGYLADLRGGTWRSTAASESGEVVDAFVDAFGDAFFGVGTDELHRAEQTSALGAATVVRADQVHQGIPVVDGRLLFTIAEDGRTLQQVRGRSFGGIDVATTPRLTAQEAIGAATTSDGRIAQGRPVLRVVPEGTGQLAWRITVADARDAANAAWLYVSAVDGRVLRRDPLTASARSMDLSGRRPATRQSAPEGLVGTVGAVAPAGTPTPVSGSDPYGDPVTATGLRTADGVALVDTTVPWFDRASGRGALETFDMGGSDDQRKVPGKLVVSPGTQIADPEAITAHSLARSVVDAYTELWGWQSWDGKGGTLQSAVNLRQEGCNAYFRWDIGTMVFTDPCRGPQGEEPQVEIDTTGHEITHGVTASSAGLLYSGQSGALNEAFSDYFGNVIGNRRKGSDNSTLFEDSCKNFTSPHTSCQLKAADGKYAVREMLNGTRYPDLLRIVGDTVRISEVVGRFGDNGGVHGNSAIWNNALWTIRTQLASIDGLPGNESPRARAFDDIVFATLTTQLTPTTDMVQASQALLGVASRGNTDPVVARVAREVFTAHGFCDECLDTTQVVGERLTRTPGSEISPVIAGDATAWIAGEPAGRLVVADSRGQGAQPVSRGEVWSAGEAGDALVYVDVDEEAIIRRAPNGQQVRLAPLTDFDSAIIGVAGSAEGAAWLSLKNGTMSFVDPSGQVKTERLPDLAGDTLLSIAAGGGSVAFGGKSGALYLWQPGSGPVNFSRVGSLPGSAISVAVHGDHVYGADLASNGVLVQAGVREPIARFQRADGFHGATLDADGLVWSRFGQDVDSAVARANAVTLPDVDLHYFSLGTHKHYSLVTNQGWQAFPHLSGKRLIWADASQGNAEIFIDQIPEGL